MPPPSIQVPTVTVSLFVALALVPGPWASGDTVASDTRPVEVRVQGIRGEMRTNAEAGLRLVRAQRAGRTLSEMEVTRLHDRAPEQIRRALEPFGHYSANVDGELEVRGDRWRATYRVEAGEPVRVETIRAEVTGEGSGDPSLEDAVDAFPLGPGDVLRHRTYEQGKRRLQAAAVERGYLDAVFRERRVQVSPGDRAASIDLVLDTGPRYRFGSVRFTGDDLDPGFLEGFVRFREGDPVSTPALLELQNALEASGLFTSAEVELARGEEDGLEVPVAVRLIPRPTRRYDVGGGFGTDTGPRGVLGGELRRLTDQGHSVEGEIRASLVRNGANATYLVPIPGAPGDRLAITAGIVDERTRDIQSTRGTVGVTWHRARGSWREAWNLDFQRERSGEGDDVRTSTVVLPSVHWTRTQMSHPVHADRGHRLRLELAGSDPVVGSDVSFGRVLASADLIRSPWEGARIILRGEAGSSIADEITDLPVSLRFYAGGDRSVRGYGYRSLAPREPDGPPLGGRHLLAGSAEVEQLVWGDWGGALFVDAGNAERNWPVTPSVGAGAGLRWLSPVGMVRLDLAAALSEPGTPLRIHFSIGPGI